MFNKQNNKMEHKLSAASIYHDLEKGIYYRIDKQTGRTQRSHKNGALITAFKLDISGNDYKKRREQEGPSIRQHIRKRAMLARPRPTQVASEKFFSPLQENRELKPSISTHLEPIRARSNINSQRMKSQESDANFLTNFQHSTIEYINETRPSNPISTILQSFSKISEQKVKENHCTLDKAAGTVLGPPMVNSRGFRQTKNIIYQPTEGQKLKRQQLRAISHQSESQARLSWGQQLSKQKRMFLQFHPDYQQRQSSKAFNQHVQRKKNIKKLQELFLQQSGKATNQIYS